MDGFGSGIGWFLVMYCLGGFLLLFFMCLTKRNAYINVYVVTKTYG